MRPAVIEFNGASNYILILVKQELLAKLIFSRRLAMDFTLLGLTFTFSDIQCAEQEHFKKFRKFVIAGF